MCHSLKEVVHPQANVPFHRGMESLIHPAQGVANRHTGAVGKRTVRCGGHKITGNRKYREVPFMTCCNADPTHPGCQVYHPCCQQPQGAQGCKTVFSCCGVEGELVCWNCRSSHSPNNPLPHQVPTIPTFTVFFARKASLSSVNHFLHYQYCSVI